MPAAVKKWEGMVSDAAKGNVFAFEALVRTFQNAAIAQAYARMENHDTAEDIAQEAFIAAFRNIAKISDPKAFPAWFHRIIVSCCNRHTRRKQVNIAPLDLAAEVPSAEPTPRVKAERNETCQQIRDAIRGLTEKERIAINLFYIDELTMAEIAEFLGTSVESIKKRLHSARAKLRGKMECMVKDDMKQHKADDKFASGIIERLFVLEHGPELGYLSYHGNRIVLPDILAEFWRKIARDTGCLLFPMSVYQPPIIRPYSYRFLLNGEEVGDGEIYPDYLMVKARGSAKAGISGFRGIDPISKKPVLWIQAKESIRANESGLRADSSGEIFLAHMALIVKKHQGKLLKRLMNNDSEIDVKNDDGLTPLSLATGYGSLSLAEHFLSKGAKVFTIHSASFLGLTEEVRRLVEQRENLSPRVTDRRILPPLILAAKQGHVEIVKILIQNGVDANLRFETGNQIETSLIAAVRSGHKAVLEVLLQNGADINATDENGWTCLHYAAKQDDKMLATFLLSHGANLKAKDRLGFTPLDVAGNMEYYELADYLAQY